MIKLLFLLQIIIITLFANTSKFSKEQKEYINNHTFTVGIEDWEPILYYDKENNQPKGVVGELFELLVNKSSLKVKYVNKSWDDLLDDFKNHKLDMLPDAYYTKSREKYANYSKSYLETKDYLYINDDNFDSFDDLNNKTIALVKGYALIEQIKNKFPKVNIIQTNNLDESIDLVLTKKADALADSQIVIEYLLKKELITGLKSKSSKYLKKNKLYIISNKKKPMLNDILNIAIDNINIKEKNKIINKWIHNNNSYKVIDKLNKKEKKYLNNKKEINICTYNKVKPIEFIENGKIIGIYKDVNDLLEKSLNIKFNYILAKDYNESTEYLDSKKCDLISYKNKDELFNNLYTSLKFLSYKYAFITKTNKTFVESFNNFKNKTIVLLENSPLKDIIKNKDKSIKIIYAKNQLEVFRKVQNNQADFTVSILPISSYYIVNYDLSNLHIAGYSNLKYHLSYKSNDKILIDILNKAISQIEEIDIKNINQKYISYNSNINQIDYTYLYYFILISFIIFMFILYRQSLLNKLNLKLKEEVLKKTIQLQKTNDLLKDINNNLELRVEEEIRKNENAKKKLFENEKLAALGEMIGNIAHQWRQPLNIISILSSSIKLNEELKKNKDFNLIKDMDSIGSTTKYLSKTIDDFANLVKGDNKKSTFKIIKVIDKCISMQYSMLNRHEIELIYDKKNNIKVRSSFNFLLQALINIINNSKDALVSNDIKKRLIIIDISEDNNKAYINIKDNANGINNNIINKIFEPYFTTKHKSQGTGLGLHITHSLIVKELKGDIYVKNEIFKFDDIEYKGASFHIELTKELKNEYIK